MGRRSLRKPDSSISLSRHFKTYDELPNPWRPEALFGRIAPLEIEVGSGKGLFLRGAAAARTDADFLGIEIREKYAQFAAAGLAKRELNNGVVVHGDGLKLFAELLPDATIAAVHVYFPDPWWKKRHKKRRVFRESFMRDIQRVLATGGELHFWTDVEEYFRTTLELLAQVTRLEGPFEVAPREAEHDMDYRTHFERRTRQHGEAVHRARFVKTQ
ncbi:MAG TPA: tRNA (guanosine(46)-N7)-methyltransferase TrmB [Planctomycetaceae bacterium]|nr:tRNA (guanosine(46)-N7)-methyltransferase TrmB [Planctomycetaceae bacterium]